MRQTRRNVHVGAAMRRCRRGRRQLFSCAVRICDWYLLGLRLGLSAERGDELGPNIRALHLQRATRYSLNNVPCTFTPVGQMCTCVLTYADPANAGIVLVANSDVALVTTATGGWMPVISLWNASFDPFARIAQRAAVVSIGPPSLCPAGFFCPPGSSSLTYQPCPEGTYLDQPGGKSESDCFRCPNGTWSKTNTTSRNGCGPCPIWVLRGRLWVVGGSQRVESLGTKGYLRGSRRG